MTDHEDLARRLRRLELPAPELHIDVHRVVAAGRRRRAARAAGVGALTLAVLAGTVGGAAALTSPDPAPPAASADPAPALKTTPSPSPSPVPTATLDVTTGEIHSPIDAYFPSRNDWVAFDGARDLFVANCMAAAGYPKNDTFGGPEAARPDLTDFGLWSRSDLAAHGYAGLSVAPVNHPSPGAVHSAAATAALQDCFQQLLPQGLEFDLDTLPEAPAGMRPVDELPDGVQVLQQWATCLQDHGVTPPSGSDGDAFIPPQVQGASLAVQIEIGTVDLDCKDQLGTLQKLADIHAAEEVRYIESDPAYAATYRDTWRPVIARDRAYLADAGITLAP